MLQYQMEILHFHLLSLTRRHIRTHKILIFYKSFFFATLFLSLTHKMVIKSKGNQAETTNEKKRKIIMVSRINQIVGWKKIEVWKMWKLRKTKIHLKNEIYLKTLNKSHFTDHHHWTHTHFQHNERCCRVFK